MVEISFCRINIESDKVLLCSVPTDLRADCREGSGGAEEEEEEEEENDFFLRLLT